MVRTRLAPSPTGEDLHIGNLYTALINWVFAKQNNGKFIVRIEDTDRKRLIEGAEERILKTLKEFGLEYDEGPDVGGPYGPYRQSERLEIYKKHALELVEKGYAYFCFCSPERLQKIRKEQQKKGIIPPKYDRYCLKRYSKQEALEKFEKGEKAVIRLKIPEKSEISFVDEIRGKITFKSDLIDDQVLLKSDGFPTYHLAVVVDDYLMKITHVIRAEEWISSTPKHVLLYEFFGWELPKFIHLPILRNPDKSKLSKRKNPVWASWYLKEGFLPEAILNYLALMGWSHPEGKEKFSIEELVKIFDIKRIKTVGPVFDVQKLEWLNGEYLREAKSEKLKAKILEYYKKYHDLDLPEELVEKTIPLIRERVKKLSDYMFYCKFFFERPKKYQMDLSPFKDLIEKMKSALEKIPEHEWKAEKIGEVMVKLYESLPEEVKNNVSRSKFFMVLRVAITGQKITPPLNESMEILGREECIERLENVKFQMTNDKSMTKSK